MITFILEHLFGWVVGGIIGTILDWAIGLGFMLLLGVVVFMLIYYVLDNWSKVKSGIEKGFASAEKTVEQVATPITTFVSQAMPAAPGAHTPAISEPSAPSIPAEPPFNGIVAKILLEGVDRGVKVIDANQTLAFADGRRVNQIYKVTDLTAQAASGAAVAAAPSATPNPSPVSPVPAVSPVQTAPIVPTPTA